MIATYEERVKARRIKFKYRRDYLLQVNHLVLLKTPENIHSTPWSFCLNGPHSQGLPSTTKAISVCNTTGKPDAILVVGFPLLTVMTRWTKF